MTNSNTAPILVSPSEKWEGNDGLWSTLSLRVGNPPQLVRLLGSMAGQENWVVAPSGCIKSDPKNCPELRGRTFTLNASTTWVSTTSIWNNTGLYNLGSVVGDYLGIVAPGAYGFDSVGLSFDSGPTLNKTIVASFIAKDYYLGQFGMSPRPTNFTVQNYNYTDLTDPQPSYLSLLKQNNIIPSVSWGFSPGSYFRSASYSNAYSSLTLGGFDQGRIRGDPTVIEMNDDEGRELLVAVKSITKNNDTSNVPVLGNAILAALDSTQPHIWLPQEACTRFEQEFGLGPPSNSSKSKGLYLLTPEQHTALVQQNPNLTFSLAPTVDSDTTLEITLPYGTLDLTAQHPLVANATPFFPLRCAANSTQYTLGRTFMQEVYVTADYERRNFSIYQAQWPSQPNKLVAIHSTNYVPPTSGNMFTQNRKLLAGVIVAPVLIALLLISTIIFFIRRRRRLRLTLSRKDSKEQELKDGDKQDQWFKPELDAETNHPQELSAMMKINELDTDFTRQELEAEVVSRLPTRPVHELDSIPVLGLELDSTSVVKPKLNSISEEPAVEVESNSAL